MRSLPTLELRTYGIDPQLQDALLAIRRAYELLRGDVNLMAAQPQGVTSVGLILPASLFTVVGSPVTSSGNLEGDLIPQSANSVFAGPTSGGAATPSFRALVGNDIPPVNLAAGGNGGVTGILPVANGGTGTETASANTIFAGPTSGAAAAPAFRQLVLADIPLIDLASHVTGILPVGNGGTGTSNPSLQAGTGIQITGTWPNQTISATGGGGGTIGSFVVANANRTFLQSDAGKLIYANGLGLLLTLPNPPFPAPWGAFVGGSGATIVNAGSGTTINGKSSILIPGNQLSMVASDGTGYWGVGAPATFAPSNGFAAILQQNPTHLWALAQSQAGSGLNAVDYGSSPFNLVSYSASGGSIGTGASPVVPGDTNYPQKFSYISAAYNNQQISSFSNNFSVCAWVSLSQLPSATSGIMGMANNFPPNGPNNYFALLFIDTTGKVYGGVWTGSATLVSASATWPGTHFICLTVQNQTALKLYIDGALAATTNFTGTVETWSPLYISFAAAYAQGPYWPSPLGSGWNYANPSIAIQYAAFWDGVVLTATQVSNMYSGAH